MGYNKDGCVMKKCTEFDKPEFDLEEYINRKAYRINCPPWLTIRELDVLMRIVPGPLGLGMSQKGVADSLGIWPETVSRICKRLWAKFPVAHERYLSMCRVMNRQRHGLRSNRSFDGLISAIGDGGLYDELFEKEKRK